MNDDIPGKSMGGGVAAQALASDIDPRFDAGASGIDSGLPSAGRAAKPAQEQLEEMATALNAWVRDKPLQALAVSAGLGFLLGRVGR